MGKDLYYMKHLSCPVHYLELRQFYNLYHCYRSRATNLLCGLGTEPGPTLFVLMILTLRKKSYVLQIIFVLKYSINNGFNELKTIFLSVLLHCLHICRYLRHLLYKCV